MATLIHFALIVPFYADTETIQSGFRGMQIAAMRQPINRKLSHCAKSDSKCK